MAEPRLRTALRVQAMLRMAQLEGMFATVARKGDADAGGVLVRLRGRAGCCVLSPVTRPDGTAGWLRATGPEAVSDAEADAYVARQMRVDPDLWVIELESSQLGAKLDSPDFGTRNSLRPNFQVPPFLGRVED